MNTLSDRIPVFEYIYSDSDRLVRCKCCGTMIPIGETITRERMTFCKDSTLCVWRRQGKDIKVEVLPVGTEIKKPLFGD